MSKFIMLQDLRHALRGFARHPAFSLTAILAASLGIGATAAVFSVVDPILFRPLPYSHEDRLLSVGMKAPLDANEFMFASEYFDLRHSPGPFEAVTAFQAGSIACDLTERDNPLRLRCLRLEANFLQTLGQRPLLGRTFSPEEDRPGGPPVAMISYGLWTTRFNRDPKVIGRTIALDGAPAVITGVLPKNFEVPTLVKIDVLLPLALNEATERQGRALRVFGRLRPGIAPAQAAAHLQPHFQRALETVPPQFRKEVSLQTRSVRERQVGEARLASLVLLGSVLAVLLIACANIANLLLARAVSRTRELAMRAALGASKWRLFRQSLTENLLLGCLGGAGGCGLASVLLRVVVAAAPANLPHIEEASLNLRVLIAAALVSLGASLLFGIVPALRTPSPLLLGGWHSVGAARVGLRSILVTIQVAFSLILLSGAGLLLRSLWLLESTPLGMQPDRVITAHFVLGRQRYLTEGAQLAFFTQLEQRLAAIPGIDSAAISDSIPPAGGTRGRPLASIAVNGRPRRPEGTGGMVAWRYVTPAYFNALGIPVRRGRAFQTADRGPVAHSVLLNESLAHLLFPGEDPLGKQVLQDGHGDWFNVVGIVADTKDHGPAQPSQPEYYMLRKAVPDSTFHNQEPPLGWREGFVMARTAIAPQLASASLRSALASIDSTLPVDLQTMPQRLEQVTSPYRFNAELLSAFALTGVVLAAIGLFGVMSFLVAHRTREIGVRMALGATPARILGATLQHALSWIATGLVLGAAGSLALSRVLRSLLFQVEPNNPAILLAAGAVLLLVGLAAAAVPATRAAKVDPIATLRQT